MYKLIILPVLVVIYFWSLNTLAGEPTNPIVLCDRFVEEVEKNKCFKKLSEIQPDWYLATVCEKVFDDKKFYECLSLSEKSNFPADKVGDCANQSGDDQKIMTCLNQMALATPDLEDAYQRSPASAAKKKQLKKEKKK